MMEDWNFWSPDWSKRITVAWDPTKVKLSHFIETELEAIVLNELKAIRDTGTDQIFPTDIEKVDMKVARGVLSSLVKKGAIYIDGDSNGLITIRK